MECYAKFYKREKNHAKIHYVVLGLDENGINPITKKPYTGIEISKAFKLAALKVHPDHNSDADAGIAFAELKKSCEFLKNPVVKKYSMKDYLRTKLLRIK